MGTENLQIPDIQASQSQKEVTANAAHNLLDRSSNSGITITVTGTFSLTAAEQRETDRIVLDGTPGSDFEMRMFDTNQRSLTVLNRTGKILTLENSANNSTKIITCPDGQGVSFHYNGNDFFLKSRFIDDNTGSIDFITLPDTPSAYSGQALKIASVKGDETGLEFIVNTGGGGGGGAGFGIANFTPKYRGCLIRLATLTGVNYTSRTNIPWDSEEFDTDNIHNNVTNKERMTVPAGVTKVRIGATIRIDNIDVDIGTDFRIDKNGVPVDGGARVIGTTTATNHWLTINTGVIEVIEGDYFEIGLQITSDTSIDINNNQSSAYMQILETNDSFSLQSVAITQKPRVRGAFLTRTVDLTGLDANPGPADILWDQELRDTDNFHDLGSNTERLTIPAGLGIKTVRLGAAVRVTDLTADLNILCRINKNGATFKGAVFQSHEIANTLPAFSMSTGVLDVVDGDYFHVSLYTQTDDDITVRELDSSFWIEVVEFEGAQDAPLAYLAVSPQNKGAVIKLSTDILTADFTSANTPVEWTASEYDTKFQPNDTGGPQRFWLGANFDFVDGDVSVANDEITETNHGFDTGEGPYRMTTTGTLPAGLATGTNYWAIRVDANTFKPAASRANAIAGTPINITAAAGGGTHTIDRQNRLVVPAGVSKVRLVGHIKIADFNSSEVAIIRINGTGTSAVTNAATYSDTASLDPSLAVSTGVIEVTEGDFFQSMLGVAADTSLTVKANESNFSIEVVETSIPLSFPGVTVHPKFRGVLVKNASDLVNKDFSTAAAMLWDTETYDTDGFHSTVSNTEDLVIPIGSGITKIRLHGQITISSAIIDEFYQTHFTKDNVFGDIPSHSAHRVQTSQVTEAIQISTGVFDVDEGDTFQMYVRCQSDADVTIASASSFSLEVVETVESTLPPNDYPIFLEGVPAINNLAWATIAARRVSFLDNFAGSIAECITAPGTEVIFDIDVEGSKIGDITFAAASNVGVFATIGATVEDVEIGERLSIDTPNDLFTMADVMITLKGFRS